MPVGVQRRRARGRALGLVEVLAGVGVRRRAASAASRRARRPRRRGVVLRDVGADDVEAAGLVLPGTGVDGVGLGVVVASARRRCSGRPARRPPAGPAGRAAGPRSPRRPAVRRGGSAAGPRRPRAWAGAAPTGGAIRSSCGADPQSPRPGGSSPLCRAVSGCPGWSLVAVGPPLGLDERAGLVRRAGPAGRRRDPGCRSCRATASNGRPAVSVVHDGGS